MTVVEVYAAGMKIFPSENKSMLPPDTIPLLIESIAQNTSRCVFVPEDPAKPSAASRGLVNVPSCEIFPVSLIDGEDIPEGLVEEECIQIWSSFRGVQTSYEASL